MKYDRVDCKRQGEFQVVWTGLNQFWAVESGIKVCMIWYILDFEQLSTDELRQRVDCNRQGEFQVVWTGLNQFGAIWIWHKSIYNSVLFLKKFVDF